MNLTGQLSIPKLFHTFKYTDLAIKSIKNYKKQVKKMNTIYKFPSAAQHLSIQILYV